MNKNFHTFLKKIILLLLSLVILLSAVACNQDTDTDDGNETYKDGLCGPDDIPKDVDKFYCGEDLADLKKVYYDEYKKKCDFKCLVPNIENAQGVTEVSYDNDLVLMTSDWNSTYPVKRHRVSFGCSWFEINDPNTDIKYTVVQCSYTVYYLDAQDIDFSDFEVDRNSFSFDIKYNGYIFLNCQIMGYIGEEDDDLENEEFYDYMINFTLDNLEYWG